MKPILSLLMMFICAASATGQMLVFEFSGSVSSFINPKNVPGSIYTGQPVTGWFSYDNSVDGAIDTSLGTTNRYNYGQVASVQVYIGDILISHLNKSVEIDVDNDQYNIRSDRNEDHFIYRFKTIVPEFGTDVISGDFYFFDYAATVFDSFALPTSFDLAAFDITEFHFSRNIQQFSVSCQIDDIILIPEPATMMFLAFGGLLLQKRR
jgi:hypothetical protein